MHELVKHIPGRCTFTNEELTSAWMTADDYNRARTEATQIYRMLDQGIPIQYDDPELCEMGIESTQRYRNRRKFHRTATCAVLSEQESQRLEGYRCETLIAMSYIEHTAIAQNRAYLAGVMMAIQARD